LTHLLDTNSCVEQLRGRASSSFIARLAAMRPGDVVLCSVVVAELLYGAARSANPPRSSAQLKRFCTPFISLPFDDRAADEYGAIRAHSERIGLPIGPNDLLIAAIARAHGLTLVSHNTVEFSRVPGLVVEDWQIP
jgi:tRNA(fMet)-specific endonuclease VapC